MMEEDALLHQEYEIQVGSWPSPIRQLLGLRKATPVVLEFLATKRARRKSSIQVWEKEEWRRSRDKMWLLDEERLKDGEEEKEENREPGDEGSELVEEVTGA